MKHTLRIITTPVFYANRRYYPEPNTVTFTGTLPTEKGIARRRLPKLMFDAGFTWTPETWTGDINPSEVWGNAP